VAQKLQVIELPECWLFHKKVTYSKEEIIMIIAVIGLPGSGKSYFAGKLAAAIHAVYISSDKVRRTLMATGHYSTEEKERVYDEMLVQTQQAVRQNKNVVLDATFYRRAIREKFMDKARDAGGIRFIEITAPEPIIKERLKQKREDSEADFEVYLRVRKQWELLQEPHLALDSSDNDIDGMLQKAIDHLQLKQPWKEYR
jgi:predicted kinase